MAAMAKMQPTDAILRSTVFLHVSTPKMRRVERKNATLPSVEKKVLDFF
jgi:hypothetical protein